MQFNVDTLALTDHMHTFSGEFPVFRRGSDEADVNAPHLRRRQNCLFRRILSKPASLFPRPASFRPSRLCACIDRRTAQVKQNERDIDRTRCWRDLMHTPRHIPRFGSWCSSSVAPFLAVSKQVRRSPNQQNDERCRLSK